MPVAKKNTRYSKKKSKLRYSKKKSKSHYSKKKANKTKKLSIKNKNIQKGGWGSPFGKSSPKVTIISDEEKEEIVKLIKKIYIYYWDEILNKNIFFPAEKESIEDLKHEIHFYFSEYEYFEKIRKNEQYNDVRSTIENEINKHIKILFSMLYERNMNIIIKNINDITNIDNIIINNIDNIIINNININNIIQEINNIHVKKKNFYNDLPSIKYYYTEINEENIKGIITNIIKPIIQVIKKLKNKKMHENDDIPYLQSLPEYEKIPWEKLGKLL